MNCLILVDIQNDFVPGGALAVSDGDQVVPVANLLMPRFDLVVATQDWHPRDHQSFASQHVDKSVGDVVPLAGLDQVLWPDHCVQGTEGAELVTELDTQRIRRIVRKGTDRFVDSYSGFFDNGHRKATGLAEYLDEHEVNRVYVMGLATDYCVKYTALDARQLGLSTNVIEDGCRAVNLCSNDGEYALRELRDAGVHVIQSHEVPLECKE
jgi:nicotinamidase/pyrazinamidase